MAPRILLCGDVLGRLDTLCKRLTSVIKANGPFDALFCVGQFFPNTVDALDEMKQYIEGSKELPLKTYFIGDFGAGSDAILYSSKMKSLNEGFLMEGIPVCKNLFWLKGSGKFVLNGLSIVYLAGRSQFNRPSLGTYSEDNVDALRACAEAPGIVDLFLTNEWPHGVLNGITSEDASFEQEHLSEGNCTISELVTELKPRYHIAGSEGVHFARPPYKNDGASHVTRFIGLGFVGNDKKQKFIHALSPTPASMLSLMELSVVPVNSTPSPYRVKKQVVCEKSTQKRNEASDSQYWRYDVSQKRQRTINNDVGAGSKLPSGVCFDYVKKGRCHKGDSCRFSHDMDAGNKVTHSFSVRHQPCWFCLSSPNVESHLIVSIGDHFYCALPKGPLVEDHLLLVPVEHIPSFLSLSSDAELELQKYKHAFKRYFKNQNRAAVMFERNINLKAASHTHLQIVPVPLVKASVVENQFRISGKELGFEFHVTRPDNNIDCKKQLKELVKGAPGYFFVELPDETVLVHRLEGEEKIPMQFGREVLANILGKPERSDWRNCQLSNVEESAMAEDFKKRFSMFDPVPSV
eukprot:TRINITY_DN8096_c0_g1_i1.p1 TRINITY_DN8096_c0_g1~~TRINITY_DN8096_c0_g1_i1.p1  ORF type:complete len:576 (-),score=113.47 TRINITY_DN8096_c0_g1_i1:191-1918(-)